MNNDIYELDDIITRLENLKRKSVNLVTEIPNAKKVKITHTKKSIKERIKNMLLQDE